MALTFQITKGLRLVTATWDNVSDEGVKALMAWRAKFICSRKTNWCGVREKEETKMLGKGNKIKVA